MRKVLQAETRELHLGLHELPVFRDLLGQRLSIERYRSLIERLYGFYLPLDERLSRGVAHMADEVPAGFYRERAPLLGHDLARLGGRVAGRGQLPLCDVLPVYSDDENVLGALYVVEGSLLGGRVLNRRLDGLFGPDNDEGRAFFTWCAAQDGHRWSRLCEALERRRDSLGGVEGIVDSAKQTFESMLTWLNAGDETGLPLADHAPSPVSGNG